MVRFVRVALRLQDAEAGSMTAKRAPKATMSEDNLQINICKLLNAYARPDVCWWCCPNGAVLPWKVAKEMKEMGVRPGAADLMFVIDGVFHGLELKTEIGVVSGEQLQYREDLERAGGFFHAAFGLDEAIGVLRGLKAFRSNVNITLSPSIADDGRGARRRPWEAKANKAANLSPVKPRRAADPVSPNT
jgi:hypothetical protein